MLEIRDNIAGTNPNTTIDAAALTFDAFDYVKGNLSVNTYMDNTAQYCASIELPRTTDAATIYSKAWLACRVNFDWGNDGDENVVNFVKIKLSNDDTWDFSDAMEIHDISSIPYMILMSIDLAMADAVGHTKFEVGFMVSGKGTPNIVVTDVRFLGLVARDQIDDATYLTRLFTFAAGNTVGEDNAGGQPSWGDELTQIVKFLNGNDGVHRLEIVSDSPAGFQVDSKGIVFEGSTNDVPADRYYLTTLSMDPSYGNRILVTKDLQVTRFLPANFKSAVGMPWSHTYEFKGKTESTTNKLTEITKNVAKVWTPNHLITWKGVDFLSRWRCSGTSYVPSNHHYPDFEFWVQVDWYLRSNWPVGNNKAGIFGTMLSVLHAKDIVANTWYTLNNMFYVPNDAFAVVSVKLPKSDTDQHYWVNDLEIELAGLLVANET